jgi:hypothetical protein
MNTEILNLVESKDADAVKFLEGLDSYSSIETSENLLTAFSWENSPQGAEFWGEIYKELRKAEIKNISFTPEYIGLINRVSLVDKEAAMYLRSEALELKSFRQSASLSSVFPWNQTKQGEEYWRNINTNLI